MSALSFTETRDLWLRMLRGWSERLNPGGCGWPGTDYAYEGATRMFWSLAAWLSHPQRPRAPELDGAALPVGLLVLRALRNGPNPAHPDHWPLTANPDDPFDQTRIAHHLASILNRPPFAPA